MILTKQMCKYACAVTMLLVLSGCNKRIIPDELVLVKYDPLEMPEKLSLPQPDKNATPLGYKPARTRLDKVVKADIFPSQPLAGVSDGVSPELLRILKLQSVDMNMASQLQDPVGQRVVVIIDQEQQRLAQNIADNLPLTHGEVPRIAAKKTKAGIDQLLGD